MWQDCFFPMHVPEIMPDMPAVPAQVAGDSNVAGQVYPDQSLYPVNSVPMLVERINNALQRADQIEHAEGHVTVSHWILCVLLAMHIFRC